MKIHQDPSSIAATKEKRIAEAGRSKNLENLQKIGLDDVGVTQATGDYAVDLSGHALEAKQAYEKAHKLAMATPPVRESKVKELRERIKNGSYEVDSGKIADGMLREAVKDHLSTSSN